MNPSSTEIPGPILFVGLILLIAFSMLWAAPLIITLMSTRQGKSVGARLDRQDRTDAMVFCYTLDPARVQQIRLLPDVKQKTAALEAEYLLQNPNVLDVEAKGVIKSYLELYGSEVGEGDGGRKRALEQTGVLALDGSITPLDYSINSEPEPLDQPEAEEPRESAT